jgi:tetratricopeptide (TPR) repeat protein
MAARATELLGQGKLAEALACSREALRPVLMAHARRGNSFYLIGNAAEAVKEHERVLEIDPDNAESLFFRGAILFDTQGDNVPQLKAAQASWEHFLATSPDSPRAKAVKEMLAQLNQAIAVGGVSKLPRPAEDDAPPAGTGGPSAPPLDPSAMQAMQGTEVKPEDIPAYDQILTEAATLLGAGKVDDARGQLVRVFPLVMAKPDKFPAPVRARAKALMGLYMQGKGAPMAGPLLAQAAGEAPEAVDALGDGLKAQGDVAHAKALWTVLQAAPGAFAGKDKLADKLK